MDFSPRHNFSPGLRTRLLLVVSVLWRLAEDLQVSTWRDNVFGKSQVFFDDPYTLHILLAPSWTVLLQFSVIALVALIWFRFGGFWGLLLILIDSFVADQGLPLGWGTLASHPAILL